MSQVSLTSSGGGSGVTSVSGVTDYTTSTGGTTPAIGIDAPLESTAMHSWNGSSLTTVDVTAASDGAAITFSAEQVGGGDVTLVFSDGYYVWDTTPADTIGLTAGTDAVPVQNYVYFLQSSKALAVSTTGWPSEEHAPLATVVCQSAASFQTQGTYKLHAWIDHVTATDDQGHVSDINYWIRQQPATYIDGVTQTYTITTNGGSADNVILTTTSGSALQLHPHTFPAFSGTPDLYVVNDSTTPYTVVTDMNALLTDSLGGSMSGRYFTLVIWGCISEDTGDCKLFVNLPSGDYGNTAQVRRDQNGYADYSIPEEFRGAGFLISKWNLRHQTADSGTWTSIDEIDLRGLFPSANAGGGGLAFTSFIDSTFRITDDSDATKEMAFQVSGVTTATTRTYTVPDANGTLALTAETGGGTNQTSYATGDILYASAANTLSKLSAGSDTEVLTLASGVPSWAAASGGGGWVYLASATASTSASINFTSSINSTYNLYAFVFEKIQVASLGARMIFRTSTNAGSSYDSGSSDYAYEVSSGGSSTQDNSSSSMKLSFGDMETTIGQGMSGILYMHTPSAATNCAFNFAVQQYTTGTSLLKLHVGAGTRLTDADVDAITFLADTGNLASGTIKMYGVSTPS